MSPYQCPYCPRQKCGQSRYCIQCQVRAVDKYREHRALAAKGTSAYFAVYDTYGRKRVRATL